jgi:tetratricopeptide (TPR) repeat protein
MEMMLRPFKEVIIVNLKIDPNTISERELREMIKSGKPLLDKHPEDYMTYTLQSAFHVLLGENREARKLLEIVTNDYPDFWLAWWLLGSLLLGIRDVAPAVPALKRALDLCDVDDYKDRIKSYHLEATIRYSMFPKKSESSERRKVSLQRDQKRAHMEKLERFVYPEEEIQTITDFMQEFVEIHNKAKSILESHDLEKGVALFNYRIEILTDLISKIKNSTRSRILMPNSKLAELKHDWEVLIGISEDKRFRKQSLEKLFECFKDTSILKEYVELRKRVQKTSLSNEGHLGLQALGLTS